MTTPTKIKHLVVGTPQGVAGDLLKEARYAFNYSARESECEVSLTMPLRAESYAGGALLPIFENTVAGLQQVPASVLDAADGMGMNGWQRLFRVELPLALPLIIEGLKIATVINIGTATIGSTVAAKGLGEVIIAGLINDNTAFILQGGLIVGLMAVLIYDGMEMIEHSITRKIGLQPH